MRVGINLSFLRPGLVGGSEVYVREVLARLQGTQDVEIVLFGSDEAVAGFELSSEKVVLGGGAYNRVRRIYVENTRLRGAINDCRVDVVWSPANFCVIRKLQVPQVTTVHDLQHVRLPDNFSRKDRAVRGALFRLTALRSARVVAISEFTRNDFIEVYGVPRERVVTIHSGVDRSWVSELPKPGGGIAELGAFGSYFYYPAASNVHKNHGLLLEAVRRLIDRGMQDVALVFTGMKTPYWSTIQKSVIRLGLTKHVHHLGFVDRSTVFKLMANAKALVFPSLFEGFGLPLLEAMQARTPVIAAKTSSIPEVVGDAAHLLEPTDLRGWVEAMGRVRTDGVWRDRLVRAGERNVERFSWEKSAQHLMDVFSSVVTQRSR
ncbi:MAG: glycosyltransferase family 1 protein [Polyangiaceae bacterium]|nr:glycosyltransferase family 1 protein [Polyangiaceae bacterium]